MGGTVSFLPVTHAGIHTLVRLNLAAMASKLSDGTVPDYMDRVIPAVAARVIEIINARVRFLCDEVCLDPSFRVFQSGK